MELLREQRHIRDSGVTSGGTWELYLQNNRIDKNTHKKGRESGRSRWIKGFWAKVSGSQPTGEVQRWEYCKKKQTHCNNSRAVVGRSSTDNVLSSNALSPESLPFRRASFANP